MNLGDIPIIWKKVIVAMSAASVALHIFLNVIGPLNCIMMGVFGFTLLLAGHIVLEINQERIQAVQDTITFS